MNNKRTLGNITALAIVGFLLQAMAVEIPLNLAKPDGKPGDATKPLKIYILAGQSNMVGMGDISGARPNYPNLFLSADPAIIPGVTPVGSIDNGKALAWVPVAKHGIYDAKTGPDLTVAVALGTVAEKLPAIAEGKNLVVTAQIDVPANGSYTVHAGFAESSYNVVLLDGKEVYRKDIGGKPVITKVALEAGKRYPLKITYRKSGSAAFWLEQVDIEGKGDLETLTKKDKKFTYLLDDADKWSARNDVTYTDPRLFPDRASSSLSATSNNGKSIGPEVGFGCVMGTFHGEQVLLIKTSMGNRSLGFDFRPPSSGRTDAANQYENFEYRMIVEGVQKTLASLEKVVPGYKGQGYEIAGFGWFQGHKDSGATKEEYEKHLVNLINDLRKEFKAPKMPVVVATVGFHGYRIVEGPWKGIWEAQMAVGDPKQHPEFVGSVASVDTRDFWFERDESPANQDYHYNRNPQTYLLVGEAMGRAMVRLQGGEAAAIPKSDHETQTAARVVAEAAEAAKPAPTAEQKAVSVAAIKPMILDGALQVYLSNPRNQPLLETARKGEKPAKVSPLLDDALDEVGDHYRAAGVSDYDWKPIGGDIKTATWDYFSFDLPATVDKTKGISDLKMTSPAGMENWYAADFDAKKAGWKSGSAPFGQPDDKVEIPDWAPRCTVPPKTLCEKDILLMRQSFEIPPLQEGHRYRIRIEGSAHINMGEGYAIYVNGKLLAESKGGIIAWRRQGHLPRGGQVWAESRVEFKGGKVTIAVANFPMNDRPPAAFIPHRNHLSVWVEEMKLPPLEQ